MTTEINFEVEAKTLGWVPQDQWKGDPDKWVDAEAFVKKGETVVPMLVRDKRMLAEQVRTLREEQEQLKKDAVKFREMVERQSTQEKQALEAQIRELQAAKAQAVTNGEGDVVVEIDDKIDKLKEKRQELNEPPKKDDAPSVHPDFKYFQEAHPWYGKDPQLTRAADGIAYIVSAENPGIQGKELYDAISERLPNLEIYKARFPDKVRKPINRVEDNSDTAPSDTGTSRRGSRDYNSLPAEAKKECERYIKNGWISDKQYKSEKDKREAYAKLYYDQEK